MAVTITVAELLDALRLNDTPAELAEVTRLLAFASEAVVKHAPDASDTAQNEAVRRLCGYLHDMPEAARNDAYANSLRNSGAQRMLLPYRIHRAGFATAVEAAQEAVGTTGNPVVDLEVDSGQLVVTFQDGSTVSLPLAGDGTDQTARDAAGTAQGRADAAQGEIDTHEVSTHNTDTTARANATSAQGALTAHEASHPSGLPTGSSQRHELKWDANTSAWLAVSDVTTVYYGAVASGDYLHVASALAAGLNTAGTRIATDSYLLYKGFNASPLRDDHMMTFWAGISQAPSVFVLVPGHTGWINNFTCTVRSGALALIVADDFVYINGIAYDVAMAIHPGVEADVGSVQFRYTTPAEVYAITQTAA